MTPYIKSILDDDQYKFSMQQAILELYPNAAATYRFINRNKTMKFPAPFAEKLQEQIETLSELRLQPKEYNWLKKACPYFKPMYLEYLKNYRYDPNQVSIYTLPDDQLGIEIGGPWHETVLWEVKLMAIISELYFATIDNEWFSRRRWDLEQKDLVKDKLRRLSNHGCEFSDFGTRRRRSAEVQQIVVDSLSNRSHFLGTSNVYLSFVLDTLPVGTMAHEFIMGISVLQGLRHANRFAMQDWMKVYGGQLGIALTDTFGTDAFLSDFDEGLARSWDGTRQDSGDPLRYCRKLLGHYRRLKVNSRTKQVVFSDGLTTDTVIKIHDEVNQNFNARYGIGTHLTNDFKDSKPLNMVIKLATMNCVPVVKLSDDPGKACGDPDAVRVAKWTFLGQKLDESTTC